MNINYDHKPAEIKTRKDLKAFFEGIEADQFCTNELQDDDGKRCALGHYGAAYLGSPYSFFPDKIGGVESDKLIEVNNAKGMGVQNPREGIKERLIKFLS